MWPFLSSQSINRKQRRNEMGGDAFIQLTAATSQVASGI